MSKRIVVLISGSGSNLQAILDQCAAGDIDGQVTAVISNRPDVLGLSRAEKAGADAITLDHKQFEDRAAFDAALAEAIDQYTPDLIVLAGFMRILTKSFVDRYHGRMLNIHPSLLPKYPGLDTHQRALDAGDHEAGATVHLVTAELDGGPLIAQAKVAISEDDTVQTLNRKVLAQEHHLYPEVVRWFCSGRLTFAEGLPQLDGEVLQFPYLFTDTNA
ncbi:phosphoribosylglycinamide formyltransferase [Reinekea blandensis]|uniref:Phosphoribosylglycinamide formyltransferase n=1 Tax=Reinekea blandensis MED297 TaxID=314283 RepID=A4BFG3_9GAMM|nr:phosphoribosylglycinamide formyltransferase [Reinekea blandensis]EAR09058.1 phosphoribosylglycinamide formyltransferase [Reinekea sp. MED297] [Reinekea blandensis MED297]